ncbi:MAG: hypothetical protein CL463_04375 [Acidimicrobiaceae bacterium]|nr:hypothetical protein [Acidimicrobiaceae bacterium]
MADHEHITVTGSTGYVGGRLVPILLQNGYRVRCVTRSVGSLQDREWTGDIEIVEADLEEKNEVYDALRGSDRAFYLVPRGVLGRAYWYLLLPAHILIWRKMLQNLVKLAEKGPRASNAPI